MVRSKTPWENMSGDNSMFLDKLTKSERRMERERKIDSIYNDDVWGTDQKILWWTWRICAGIVVGLVLMIGWSAATGLLN
jgi:hypothetical protein